jgi:hypothetical protein
MFLYRKEQNASELTQVRLTYSNILRIGAGKLSESTDTK